MSGSILEAVTTAVLAAVPDVVSMPIADVAEAGEPDSVRPFGLGGGLGARRFETGLEVTAGANPLQVRAMFRGILSELGFGSSLDFLDRDVEGVSEDRLQAGAWFYLPLGPALVLQVSALAPLRGALGARPGTTVSTGHRAWRHPIELPPPAWVIYEGVTLQMDPGVSARRRETFDRIPADFPAAGQSWGDWGGGVPTEEVEALLEDYDERLRDLVTLLLGDVTLRAYVVGHTDSTAREQHNEALSQRRAEMFRDRMQEIAEELGGVRLDEYQLNLRWKGERLLRYRSDADDPGQRALNRRVEILVTAVEDVEVTAGQLIATASGRLRVTVLDRAGRFLDPLDVVRRYDQDGRFARHVLAGHRDPLAPAIASGWVHCVTPAGTTGDGVSDPEDASRFAFLPLDPSDDNPLEAVLEGDQLGGVQPADVVWLADVTSVHATLELETPITLVAKRADASVTVVTPADSTEPILTIRDPGALGCRILGLTLLNGRADDGGAAIRMAGPDGATLVERDRRARAGESPLPVQNIHVAGCRFANHIPTGSAARGGAIHARECANVLVEDCQFEQNTAADGGAVYALQCTNVVVGGRALDPAVEAEFATLVSDPGSGTDPTPAALERQQHGTRFFRNTATGSGGAVAFDGSTFEVGGCFFQENVATDGIGGAVAACLDEPATLSAAKTVLARPEPGGGIPRSRNRITHCVAQMNLAGLDGGAVAIVGRGPSAEDAEEGGGACHVRETILRLNLAAEGRGGGLFLAAGATYGGRNRLESNGAHVAGGGIACVGQAHVRLTENLVFRNYVQPQGGLWPSADPMGRVGMRGGGGLYARGFSEADQTTVWLAGFNWFTGNQSQADGGGALVVSGARLVCGWTSPDVFESNEATWSGGGISARNADLEIHAQEQFLSNRALRGYGGGVFFGGTTMYGGPQSLQDLGADAFAGRMTALPSARGARLAIQGTADAPVHFVSNRASHGEVGGQDVGGFGAALFIVQQSAGPVMVPAGEEVRRSVGLVRRVFVQWVNCLDNESDGGPGGFVAMVAQGLDHPWIPEYDAYLFVPSKRDAWIGRTASGAYDLGPYEIRDVTMDIDQGSGLWMINSADSLVRSGFTASAGGGGPFDLIVNRSPELPLHP
jgi:predicted outer membrane repeat protein